MSHLVLAGDSIFDNASYVPGCPAVCDQMKSWLGSDWKVTLLATDGAVCNNLSKQLEKIPDDTSHLCISIGGNDALFASGIMLDEKAMARQVIDKLAAVRTQFRADYLAMLKQVMALRMPVVVCTIYDAIPEFSDREATGLALFNDMIISCASEYGIPVIDLRKICDDREDFSKLSPIEPSELGGAKIVSSIKNVILNHDFTSTRTCIYTN